MIRLLFSALLLLLCTGVRAQTELSDEAMDYLYELSRKVDPDRYTEVRGTPYRYKKFGKAIVYDITLNAYPLDSVNLNGFTSQFEFIIGGMKRELQPENFIRVEFEGPNGKDKYARGINPKFRDMYAQIVHKGDNLVATMVYEVKNDEKIVQDVGKTVRLRRFSPKSLHFAMVEGELVTIVLSAKRLAGDLGFKKELGAFIKAEKLKPGKIADLVRIYEKADDLLN